MILSAHEAPDHWVLKTPHGHSLLLPRDPARISRGVSIGVLGTRRRVKVPGTMGHLLGDMLAGLGRPIYLVDVRRNGAGAQGSWGPREFATLIPERIAGRVPYDYLHVPALAPSIALLESSRRASGTAGAQAWQAFRDHYVQELADREALPIAQALVEAATSTPGEGGRSGLAVFLCAEADQPCFTGMKQAEQDAHYCHRFTLAGLVAQALAGAHPGAKVELLQLDLVDSKEQTMRGGVYMPRSAVLFP